MLIVLRKCGSQSAQIAVNPEAYECAACGKTFVFTTQLHYYAKKADCLNGRPHRFKHGDRVYCMDCGYEDNSKHEPKDVEPIWREPSLQGILDD